ncbi:Tether containing UBX domain for GLUT4 [Leucoagaricus sp. SymC.cos]|nr:Tether containing UBX domain for GLUT4 [Leucoagaricus sp. SymC.cos]
MSEPTQPVAPQSQESQSGLTSQFQTLPPTPYKVFKPSDTVTRLLPSLPDEYFEPSAADLKDAQATLSARTRALNDAPLQLRTVRETAEKAKRDRWPYVCVYPIRVRFPDRTQLEGIFPSTDKIKSVYAFVRELLKDDVKPIKFILYQSPPKRDLKVSDPNVRGLSLSELQLAPASVLLLRFEDESLNHVNVTAPLLPEVLAQAVDLPIPADSERSNSQSPPTGSGQPSGVSKLISQGEKKIPKWLKMGSEYLLIRKSTPNFSSLFQRSSIIPTGIEPALISVISRSESYRLSLLTMLAIHQLHPGCCCQDGSCATLLQQFESHFPTDRQCKLGFLRRPVGMPRASQRAHSEKHLCNRISMPAFALDHFARLTPR